MEVQSVLPCRIRRDLMMSVLLCECQRHLLWCCKGEVFAERHVILRAVPCCLAMLMVRLHRVPHTVICGVKVFFRSHGGGKHSSFAILSTLITECPVSTARKSASPPKRRNKTWSQSSSKPNRACKVRVDPTADSGGMSCSTTMNPIIPLHRASRKGM